jgi:hypothetical protein
VGNDLDATRAKFCGESVYEPNLASFAAAFLTTKYANHFSRQHDLSLIAFLYLLQTGGQADLLHGDNDSCSILLEHTSSSRQPLKFLCPISNT